MYIRSFVINMVCYISILRLLSAKINLRIKLGISGGDVSAMFFVIRRDKVYLG